MIYDKTHKVFLIHARERKWRLVWGEKLNIEASQAVSENEKSYACLWKNFFETVSIKERENPGCQRNHLPLHFRGDMTEFKSNRKDIV